MSEDYLTVWLPEIMTCGRQWQTIYLVSEILNVQSKYKSEKDIRQQISDFTKDKNYSIYSKKISHSNQITNLAIAD